MLRIGLTGGIGSGKSTVADMFEKHGITIIDADIIVHELSQPGQSTHAMIVECFGPSVLNVDGTLDRAWLRDQVFSNPINKSKLENILHPAVRRTIEQQLSLITSPYCLLVIPLLLETGFTDLVDRILVVMASEEIRTERVRQRSGLSNEQVSAIMVTQASDSQRLEIADDVIINEHALESLSAQVDELDRQYRALAKSV